MLMDQTMSVMEIFVRELKEADPQKRDHFEKMAVAFLEISTEALKQNPEFRRAFGRVHAEFLKYPESRDVLKQGYEAFREAVNPSSHGV